MLKTRLCELLGLELQRDWTRRETYAGATDIIKQNGGGYGIGSSIESRVSDCPVEPALWIPPSITKCATWMPCGASSRARLWASPRRANSWRMESTPNIP